MTGEHDVVIHDGRIVTRDGIIRSDLAIKGTIISAIGNNLGAAKMTVSATGKYVMPGGIDSHAHIEQMSGMGQMNADTFETATRSAAMCVIEGHTGLLAALPRLKLLRASERHD